MPTGHQARIDPAVYALVESIGEEWRRKPPYPHLVLPSQLTPARVLVILALEAIEQRWPGRAAEFFNKHGEG